MTESTEGLRAEVAEKTASDSGEWLREYQAACARERGLVDENAKLASALAEAKRQPAQGGLPALGDYVDIFEGRNGARVLGHAFWIFGDHRDEQFHRVDFEGKTWRRVQQTQPAVAPPACSKCKSQGEWCACDKAAQPPAPVKLPRLEAVQRWFPNFCRDGQTMDRGSMGAWMDGGEAIRAARLDLDDAIAANDTKWADAIAAHLARIAGLESSVATWKACATDADGRGREQIAHLESELAQASADAREIQTKLEDAVALEKNISHGRHEEIVRPKSSGFSCGPTGLPHSVSPEFLRALKAAGARESLVRAVASKANAK